MGDTNQCEGQVQKVLLGLVSRNLVCLLEEFWPAEPPEERWCRGAMKPVTWQFRVAGRTLLVHTLS